MDLTTSSLNGNFGIKINDVTPSDLTDPAFQSCAYDLWLAHGGLLAVRGTALADLSPDQFLAWSAVFGSIEQRVQVAREQAVHRGELRAREGRCHLTKAARGGVLGRAVRGAEIRSVDIGRRGGRRGFTVGSPCPYPY